MSDRLILSVHVQKLGHKIQEIRERALLNILSKFEHGFVYDNGLARSKEILSKLFEWFLFEPCTYQNHALNLIQRILKSETGLPLMNYYGKDTIASELRKIRCIVEPEYYPLVDELLLLVHTFEKGLVDVPPLQSDLPLSYRTEESDKFGAMTFTVNSTATPIEGLIKCDSSKEPQTGIGDRFYQDSLRHDSPLEASTELLGSCTLKWQSLIQPDRHVLESVEESLKNPTNPSIFLSSCEFFLDVMLQDFPAEIFLQRPTIVLLFHDYLKTATSNRLTNSILQCFYKLTKYVTTRIHYYRDPCTFTLRDNNIIGKSTSNFYSTKHFYANTANSIDYDEDTDLLKSKQLSIPHYCLMTIICVFEYIYIKPTSLKEERITKKKSLIGINLSLVLMDELVYLLSLCLKANVWDKNFAPGLSHILHKFKEMLERLGDVLEHFRFKVVSSNFNKTDRIIHLHLLYTTTRILLNLIPLNKVDFVLPKQLKNALSSILLDSTLARLYPNIHETIFQFAKEFGGHFQTDSILKYKEIQSVSSSLSAAINLIRAHKSMAFRTNVKLAKEGVLGLEFHKNLEFISIVVSHCSNKLPTHLEEDDIVKNCINIVVSLLSHTCSEISEEMYKLCHKQVISAIGTKLNTSGAGVPGCQILFLLQSPVLAEICLYGLTNLNKQIQKYSIDIMVHIVKCKILVSESIWNRVIQALIPIMPILTCFTDKCSTLGRSLMAMLDPDNARLSNIPSIEVLKGNLRLLFIDDLLTCEEAISRLLWFMGVQKNSTDLLPRLNNLQDEALGNVCQLTRTVEINKVRPSQRFYQPSALVQVLELLNSDNVEPVIRRSAMTQISVMLEDFLLLHTFLDCNGIKTVVSVMESALTENSYKDYIDSIIPAVVILKNVCLYNALARQDLCNNMDVYFYILRGLFMFSAEDRMRQDCSILLFLLLFHDYILGTPAKSDLSLPHLMNEKLILPLICNSHWRNSKNALPSLAATLLSDTWCLSSLQIHWNSEWFGGFRELLEWEEVKYSETDLIQFDEQLRLTNMDLLALKNSSLNYCISKCLTDIQNGTSHKAVIDSVGMLQSYINLYIRTENEIKLINQNILDFPWEYSFSRFLNAPPVNEEDMLLLIAIIKFLMVLVPLYMAKNQSCWITTILKSPSHCLPNLLQLESSPEFELKILRQELLNLITVTVCEEQHFFNLYAPLSNDEVSSESWLHMIKIILANMKFNNSEHFYNLAYLDTMLSCLMHLTAVLGWSQSKAKSAPKEPIPALVLGLCELIGAFRCGKGSSAAASLMGLSVTRHILLILNHLLSEMQHYNVKSFELCFIGEDMVDENILHTLSALWISKDIILKAAILQLLSGLAVSPRAAIELVQDFPSNKINNDIWEMALTILLDHQEASVVRENAASLLDNLTSHTSSQGTFLEHLAPINVKKKNNPIEAVLSILEEYNFYKELQVILRSVYVSPVISFYSNEERFHTAQSFSNTLDKEEVAYVYTKNILPNLNMDSPSNTDFNAVVTPSMLKAVTCFVYNLLVLAEEQISNALQEFGLVKMFFRCLTNPLVKVDNSRDLALYCDILEMNTAISALLSRAVSTSQVCLGTILHTRDCLNVMLTLLNPSIYLVHLPQLIYLRNKVWTEVFNLIGALLNSDLQKNRDIRNGEALTVVTSVINECGHQPFLQTLCEAINFNSSSDLQHSALSSLTSMLCLESKQSSNESKRVKSNSSVISIQNMLDTIKTPRSPILDEETEENIESSQKRINKRQDLSNKSDKEMDLFKNVYFGKISQKVNKQNKKLIFNMEKTIESDKCESLMAGAELCRILLRLYDASNIKCKDGKQSKRRTVVVNTLTSILCVSQEAKQLALQYGLVEILMQQLRELSIKLSINSVECLRRVRDKKSVNLVLKELNNLVGLVTNFMLGAVNVKCELSTNGLSDLVHKMWIWLCIEHSLLTDTLKMLCTYTTDCAIACQSLTLTSSVAGSGPRKTPSSLSLLHEIVALISKEMDFISRTHDLTIFELAFNVLHNSCSAMECRNVLAKSSLFINLSRLHPALTKKQKPWDSVECIWIEFLLVFTSYPEGQVSIAKHTDALEHIMMLSSNSKLTNKREALLVLRNIAFYQQNRPRLLNCDDFINILGTKLTNGSADEKVIVVTIMWSLLANNQKAKLVLKCAGLDSKLQQCIKCLSLSPEEEVDPRIIDTMIYVLSCLKDGEKNK